MMPASEGPSRFLPASIEWHAWHFRYTRRPAAASPPPVAAGTTAATGAGPPALEGGGAFAAFSACHDRATQAEKSVCPPRCYRVGERKLRVNRLVSLAFSGPTAGAARVVLRTVAVVTAATSQHLPAMEL